jgi:hypothetical protein
VIAMCVGALGTASCMTHGSRSLVSLSSQTGSSTVVVEAESSTAFIKTCRDHIDPGKADHGMSYRPLLELARMALIHLDAWVGRRSWANHQSMLARRHATDSKARKQQRPSPRSKKACSSSAHNVCLFFFFFLLLLFFSFNQLQMRQSWILTLIDPLFLTCPFFPPRPLHSFGPRPNAIQNTPSTPSHTGGRTPSHTRGGGSLALSPPQLNPIQSNPIYFFPKSEEEGEVDRGRLGEGLRGNLLRKRLDLGVLRRLGGDDKVDVGRVRDRVLQDGVDGDAVPLRDLACPETENVLGVVVGSELTNGLVMLMLLGPSSIMLRAVPQAFRYGWTIET